MKWSILAILALAGCGGGKIANCELLVGDTFVCLEQDMSVSFCEDLGGEASVSQSSSDATCADQGFPIECEGEIRNGDDGQTRWWVQSEGDCEATDGGTYGPGE